MLTKLSLLIVSLLNIECLAQTVAPGAEELTLDQLNAIPYAARELYGGGSSNEDFNSIDKRIVPNLPTPGDQGTYQASCVAFATAYAVKSYHEQIPNSEGTVKPFSPSYIYNKIKKNKTGAASIVAAAEILKEEGVVLWEDFPYNKDDKDSVNIVPAKSLKNKASKYKIKGISKIPLIDIKKWIDKGQPVVVLVHFHADYKNEKIVRQFSALKPNLFPHYMVIVDYNESEELFILMNSWGSNAHDLGFVKIGYEAFEKMLYWQYSNKEGRVHSAFVLHDLDDVEERATAIAKSRGDDYDPVESVIQGDLEKESAELYQVDLGGKLTDFGGKMVKINVRSAPSTRESVVICNLFDGEKVVLFKNQNNFNSNWRYVSFIRGKSVIDGYVYTDYLVKSNEVSNDKINREYMVSLQDGPIAEVNLRSEPRSMNRNSGNSTDVVTILYNGDPLQLIGNQIKNESGELWTPVKIKQGDLKKEGFIRSDFIQKITN